MTRRQAPAATLSRGSTGSPRAGSLVLSLPKDSSRWGWGPSASAKAPAATPSRGHGDPRRGVSVSSRWGWGPSASAKKIRRVVLTVSLMYVATRMGADAASGVTFTDVSAAAGIRFVHNNGAFGGKYLPETLGSGCAFVDVDGDGWQDIFFVNSKSWPGHGKAPSYPALYRNNHDGTFTDITRQSGLAVEMYGLGVAAADFDNDGRIDLYVTALESNHLFRNVGGGKFVDVTRAAGVADAGL